MALAAQRFLTIKYDDFSTMIAGIFVMRADRMNRSVLALAHHN